MLMQKFYYGVLKLVIRVTKLVSTQQSTQLPKMKKQEMYHVKNTSTKLLSMPANESIGIIGMSIIKS